MNNDNKVIAMKYLGVDPLVFIEAMDNHWVNTLGNTSSEALRAVWMTLGQTFNQVIASYGDIGGKWKILNPPTGTGKSQGLAVYSALIAKAGKDSDKPSGILIVTRLMAEADDLAERINNLAGFECAISNHSGKRTLPEVVKQFPVLVITHAAYVNALQRITANDTWENIHQWIPQGIIEIPRVLTVIDESLGNIIEANQITDQDIRTALSYIDSEIEQKFPAPVKALRGLSDTLEKFSTQNIDRTSPMPTRVVWSAVANGAINFPEEFRMDELRRYMREEVAYDEIDLKAKSSSAKLIKANIVDTTLRDVEAIFSTWAYHVKRGNFFTFNSARLLIPEGAISPVILDATATQQMLWRLLEDRAEIIPAPGGSRKYSNLTLFVSRVAGLGKSRMKDLAPERFSRALRDIEKRSGKSRNTLFICHKSVEHQAVSLSPEFSEFKVGHWGALDGRNDWRTCDTAILIGLPYRGPIWSNNLFMATQGLQTNEWLSNPQWKEFEDIRLEMGIRQLTTDIIQAMNRVSCRAVIDSLGNCPKSEIYITLPSDKSGDEIITNIKEEMPGIQVETWDLEIDGEKALIRKGSSHEGLLVLMNNSDPGEITTKQVMSDLGLSKEGMKSLLKVVRDPNHQLNRALADIGVVYQPIKGRGDTSFFQKSDLTIRY
jgi:hypothetical protein